MARTQSRLGKAPPCKDCNDSKELAWDAVDECPNAWHYRKCLLECSNELKRMGDVCDTDFYDLTEKIRISAGLDIYGNPMQTKLKKEEKCKHYGFHGTDKEHKTGEARCDQCGKTEKQIKREKK